MIFQNDFVEYRYVSVFHDMVFDPLLHHLVDSSSLYALEMLHLQHNPPLAMSGKISWRALPKPVDLEVKMMVTRNL